MHWSSIQHLGFKPLFDQLATNNKDTTDDDSSSQTAGTPPSNGTSLSKRGRTHIGCDLLKTANEPCVNLVPFASPGPGTPTPMKNSHCLRCCCPSTIATSPEVAHPYLFHLHYPMELVQMNTKLAEYQRAMGFVLAELPATGKCHCESHHQTNTYSENDSTREQNETNECRTDTQKNNTTNGKNTWQTNVVHEIA